ncbi:NAD-dependent epimerase/dehydratase family protein [Candidatus Woesearchaeota archaeon]|nr:NAD-dependent epimerase/dehydratase family protein [Candidatus Woesearchaeota archaeon]
MESTQLTQFGGKRVLITGGLGMIGSSIAQALVPAGADVILVDAFLEKYGANRANLEGIADKPNCRVNVADIRDAAAMAELVKGQDYIFNLAGQVDHNSSLDDPLLDLDINYRAHVTLLEACLRNNRDVKIFHAGSRLQYGKVHYNPVDEHHPREPLTPYATNKNAAENYYRYCHNRFGLRTVMFRIANPYGPRCQIKHNKYGMVNYFIRKALDNEEITVFGDGSQIRDFIYIDDLVDAFLKVALNERTSGEVYNVGSGNGISFKTMAETIVRAVGSGTVKHIPWPENYVNVETGDYVSNIGKLRDHTGWTPSTPFEEGVRRTVEYYRDPAVRARYLPPAKP